MGCQCFIGRRRQRIHRSRLAEGIISVEMTDQVSEDCKAAVEAASQEIIDGKIKCEDFFSDKAK